MGSRQVDAGIRDTPRWGNAAGRKLQVSQSLTRQEGGLFRARDKGDYGVGVVKACGAAQCCFWNTAGDSVL